MEPDMAFARQSGLILHPTSLPGPFGIGEIGAAACGFIDAMQAGGQSVWQILPIHALGNAASPYSANTTFAMNTLVCDVAELMEMGLLTEEDVAPLRALPDSHVDYAGAIPLRDGVLMTAARRFAAAPGALAGELAAYRAGHGPVWLDDYALWEALSRHHNRDWWLNWPEGQRNRIPEDLEAARRDLAGEIDAIIALQFLTERQWQALRAYAHERGVWILGDMAIFVAHDSAEVWAARDQFKLDADARQTVQAGVPPDYFSETGQLWGNPIYDWDAMEKDGFAWWIARVRRLLQLSDAVRIDHFRGFAACWETPAGETTAINGAWVPAPGHALFSALFEAMPDTRVVAEDLGVITPDVEALLAAFDFPGLKVLQFQFGGTGPHGDRHPFHYPANSVTYTGTHDTDTTVGWFHNNGADHEARKNDAEREAANALSLLGGDGSDIHWRMIELALKSGSNLAIIPLQDVLGLGPEGRMNVPGTIEGNWQWRYRDGDITSRQLAQLRSLAEESGRL
jgi:4-alpha-glucanotransferase